MKPACAKFHRPVTFRVSAKPRVIRTCGAEVATPVQKI